MDYELIILLSIILIILTGVYLFILKVSNTNFKLYTEIGLNRKNILVMFIASVLLILTLLIDEFIEIDYFDIYWIIYIIWFIPYIVLSVHKNRTYQSRKDPLIKDYEDEVYSIVEDYIKRNNPHKELKIDVIRHHEKDGEELVSYLTLEYYYQDKKFYEENLSVVNVSLLKKKYVISVSFYNKEAVIQSLQTCLEPFFMDKLCYVDKLKDINKYIKADLNKNMIYYASCVEEEDSSPYYGYYFEILDKEIIKYLQECSIDYKKPMYLVGNQVDEKIEYSVVYQGYYSGDTKYYIIKIKNGLIFIDGTLGDECSIVIRLLVDEMVNYEKED